MQENGNLIFQWLMKNPVLARIAIRAIISIRHVTVDYMLYYLFLNGICHQESHRADYKCK